MTVIDKDKRTPATLEEIPQSRRNIKQLIPIESDSAHLLTEHSFRVTQEKIIDRLVKRNEEKLINSLLHEAFADVKFKNVENHEQQKTTKVLLSNRPKLNSLFVSN
jgi:hypothetical protein